MDLKRGTKDSNESPMRSLSSFKDEIPGGDFPSKDDDDDAKKSFPEMIEQRVNSAPFHITVLLLVFAHCLILTAELCLAVSGGDPCNDDSCAGLGATIQALAITCLSVLSFFILEISFRLFSTGFSLLKKRLECSIFSVNVCDGVINLMTLFDISVVITTFTLDVVLLTGQLHDDRQYTRALGYLILLRCWRLYSIYYAEVKKIHNDLRTDIEMAKYGRRQAEAQADTLQQERDAKLKEIFLLRGLMRQHSMDPDAHLSQYVQSSPFHGNAGYSRTVSIDRAETMREETRLYPAYSTESAISSLADYKPREVHAIQEYRNQLSHESLNNSLNNSVFERSPAHNNNNEPPSDAVSHDGLSEKSVTLEGSEYQSAEEGDDMDQSEHRDHEPDKIDCLEGSESDIVPKVETEKSEKSDSVEMGVPKERVVPLVKGVPEDGVTPSYGEKEEIQQRVAAAAREGIDNPAYNGDDDDDDNTLHSEEQEMEQLNQDTSIPPADSIDVELDESRRRALSDLNGVTEDVNGVPMTSL